MKNRFKPLLAAIALSAISMTACQNQHHNSEADKLEAITIINQDIRNYVGDICQQTSSISLDDCVDNQTSILNTQLRAMNLENFASLASDSLDQYGENNQNRDQYREDYNEILEAIDERYGSIIVSGISTHNNKDQTTSSFAILRVSQGLTRNPIARFIMDQTAAHTPLTSDSVSSFIRNTYYR